MIVKVIKNFHQFLDEINKNTELLKSGIIPFEMFSNDFQNEIIFNDSDSIILSPNKNFDADFLIIHHEENKIRISYVDINKRIQLYVIEKTKATAELES